jgi:hypothetical protein
MFVEMLEKYQSFLRLLPLMSFYQPLSQLYSDSIQMTIMYFNILTIFGHFFANCMVIFQKTEVQTIILRCLTGLNLEF